MQRLSLLVGAVFADQYQSQQGLCKGPTGNKIAEWRKQRKAWCASECDARPNCQSFVFAEGARHMYTGTCALYDMHNPIADGNGGWTCYDRVRQAPSHNLYQRDQGICHNPRGDGLGMWRRTNKTWCQQQCDKDAKC